MGWDLLKNKQAVKETNKDKMLEEKPEEKNSSM